MRVLFGLGLAAAVLISATPSFAQTSTTMGGSGDVKCPTLLPAPEHLRAWNTHPYGPGLVPSHEMLRSDAAITLPLKVHEYIQYPVAPRILKPKFFGGVFPLNIVAAGTYGVATSGSSWIDVIKDGQMMPSVGYEPGSSCTGIHKVVYFNLTPGIYTVELSNSAAPFVRLMLVAGAPTGLVRK